MRIERWRSPTGRARDLVHLDARGAAAYARAARVAFPRPYRGRSFGSARGPERAPRFDRERRAWRRAVVAGSRPGAVCEIADVADCFGSIGEVALRRAARSARGDPEPLLAVLRLMWDAGVRGLPIGPVPSSFVADAVLAIADEHARTAGLAPIRWVDDVAFLGDAARVARASRAWRRALADLRMAEQGAKGLLIPAVDAPAALGLLTSLRRAPSRGIIRLP